MIHHIQENNVLMIDFTSEMIQPTGIRMTYLSAGGKSKSRILYPAKLLLKTENKDTARQRPKESIASRPVLQEMVKQIPQV